MKSHFVNRLYILMFFVFWLIAGLRYETGVDWPGYTIFFNNIPDINKLGKIEGYDEFEIGYTLLNSFFRTFTTNVQWLFLFIAFVTNLMLFKTIKKYSNHVFLSLLIYYSTIYFILDMSGIRQCIALNLFLISIKYIVDKKFYKYLLLIVLASLFHTTALILIPIYFILNKEFKNWVSIIIICIGLLISFFQISWLSFSLGKFIDLFYIKAITGKLYGYSLREDSRNFGLGFFLNLMIFVFFILNKKRMRNNKMYNIFFNMYIISLFFYYYIWEITEISSRLRMYFSLGNIFIFGYLIDIYRSRLKKYLIYSFVVLFSIFYCSIYVFEMPEGIAYNPYQNYLISNLFNMKSTANERLSKYYNVSKK